MLTLQFTGRIWYWPGPAPWYFVSVDRVRIELTTGDPR